jgi:hypothetical protein
MILTTFIVGIIAVIALCYTVRTANKARSCKGERTGHFAPLGSGWLSKLADRNRPWIKTELAGSATVLLILTLIYQCVALSRTALPGWGEVAPWAEPVHSTEWQTWRVKIHEKLSVEPVTEKALIDALRIKIPSLPNSHTEADVLRRDQAIADVLVSYAGVKKILARRLGIYEDFLGTGLSKPLGPTPYSFTSVHEYFVENQSDTHPHVWLWKLSPPGTGFSIPVQTLISGDGERVAPDNHQKGSRDFDDELKEILLRVKNKHHPLPPMIRFARFDQVKYKGTLGRPEAAQVFTSNLSEVWDLTIQQAAEKSGYRYKDNGDTLFIWVFVPYHSNEFAPATWRQVIERLPDWLESKDH